MIKRKDDNETEEEVGERPDLVDSSDSEGEEEADEGEVALRPTPTYGRRPRRHSLRRSVVYNGCGIDCGCNHSMAGETRLSLTGVTSKLATYFAGETRAALLGVPSSPAICALTAVEPHAASAVKSDEWVEIAVGVDNVATETVIPETTLASVIDITAGPGTRTPNLGERRFVGYTKDGAANGMKAQVCAVNETLLNASKLTKRGNRVVFDDDGSYVENKSTGQRT